MLLFCKLQIISMNNSVCYWHYCQSWELPQCEILPIISDLWVTNYVKVKFCLLSFCMLQIMEGNISLMVLKVTDYANVIFRLLLYKLQIM
jgi:hypothetical protein